MYKEGALRCLAGTAIGETFFLTEPQSTVSCEEHFSSIDFSPIDVDSSGMVRFNRQIHIPL